VKKSDTPLPVKLVCGLLFRSEDPLERGLDSLKAELGEMDFRSGNLEFSFTGYYEKEMGTPLFRVFVGFHRLIDPVELSTVKTITNRIERSDTLSLHHNRSLNIDPGYLNPTAYILATSKNYAHRIYLGKGVFAQQELLFERSRIRTLDWTYPDYRSIEYQEVLRKIRRIYLDQIKELFGP